MEFSKLYQRANEPVMSSKERLGASVLIVESEQTIRATLRQALTSLDFGYISDAVDNIGALKKIEERAFTHVIFDVRKNGMPAKEFLGRALEYDARMIVLPTSYEPSVDDVFDLLIAGARGFLVKPFTSGTVDEAIVMATKGEPISESILFAKSRNEALVSLMLSSLDKYATIMRQSKSFDTAKRELPRRELAFRRAVDIGRTFAHGGEQSLMDAILEFAVERCEGPATRLGRIRKFLGKRKGATPESGDAGDEAEEEEEHSVGSDRA